MENITTKNVIGCDNEKGSGTANGYQNRNKYLNDNMNENKLESK